jgi:hypothetical protein
LKQEHLSWQQLSQATEKRLKALEQQELNITSFMKQVSFDLNAKLSEININHLKSMAIHEIVQEEV